MKLLKNFSTIQIRGRLCSEALISKVWVPLGSGVQANSAEVGSNEFWDPTNFFGPTPDSDIKMSQRRRGSVIGLSL